MSWLGQNGASRDDFYALADAYKKMYNQENLQEDPEVSEETLEEGRSSRPRYPGGRGVLDQERRDEKRDAAAENVKGHTFGKGGVTKDPKKLRKQRAMGELPEEFETWLDGILDEGADLSEYTMDEMFDYWENEVLSEEVIDEYDVSYTDGCLIEEGKKSCKKGYKWDSKKGKCVKKKKSSSSKSSKKTVVVVKGGGYRMPWMGGGHSHGHDNDKDTDKGDNGGGDAGGDAGGGDGAGGGE